jgi:hypothetical protein
MAVRPATALMFLFICRSSTLVVQFQDPFRHRLAAAIDGQHGSRAIAKETHDQ